MKAMRWLQGGLILVLVFSSSCAHRSDWIEETLVTVDVTGRWVSGVGPGFFDMSLQQNGPKAVGEVKVYGWNAQLWSGPIEGTVSGDVFKFSNREGRLRGELTVSADQMSGTAYLTGNGWRTLMLQRQR